MPSSPLAVILSACRTPIAAFGGALKDLSAADLGAVVIREAIARSRVEPGEVGDVILGCVLQAAAGMNVARQAAIKAGVPVSVPAETVNRVCGSGLQAVVHAVEGVRMGLHRLHRGRRDRIDVERALCAEGSALGVSHGSRRDRRHDDSRRPDRRDAPVSHGTDRGGSRREVPDFTRRSGPVRGGESAAGWCGYRFRRLQGRDRCGAGSAEARRPDRLRDR